MAIVGKCRFLAQGWGRKSWQLWRDGCPREGTVGEDLTVLLFSVDHDTYEFLPPSRVTFVMLRVCFKSITWYIEMHHVKAFSLCGVMTFSYYVMFIHNMFLFHTYRDFRIESIKWKTHTEISSSNHNRETTFSHVGVAFHPIRNQLSKWISQFTTDSRCCWGLFNLHFRRVFTSFLQFSRK